MSNGKTKFGASEKQAQLITNRVLASLAEQIANGDGKKWTKPWNCVSGADGIATNFATRKEYQGINVFALGLATMMVGYKRNQWLTIRQAKELGATLKPDVPEKSGEAIVVYKPQRYTRKDRNGNPLLDSSGNPITAFYPMIRLYFVYNVEQFDGLELEPIDTTPKPEPQRIAACEDLWKAFADAPPVSHGGNRAYYRPSADSIRMPERDQFPKQEHYYSTLFHEGAHATGHEKRLNRQSLVKHTNFGDHTYTREELVAEMAAALMSARAGIEHVTGNDSLNYLQHWYRVFKDEPGELIAAAQHAQRAADYMCGLKRNATEDKSE